MKLSVTPDQDGRGIAVPRGDQLANRMPARIVPTDRAIAATTSNISALCVELRDPEYAYERRA